ncbi:ExbD/TolR family protein [Roseitranquillus sediminis]|uniref:ExbD/TolR family protein n=1 Tax=Roseitranquillus sediminis TaxID=2809051 RepID=UPI001D0C04EA|nr:biopolymer transporter ExbD [Roseitranquillus sediminis]MBM9594400.1 biopolymer transporter ExbD [Roseitranquillus sediminis]
MLPDGALAARFRPRRLSLTPLIDVIFLLLMFFMLSSTFVRLGEIEINSAGTETASQPSHFMQLRQDRLTLNGRDVALADLAQAIGDGTVGDKLVLDVDDVASAQRLADVLAALSSLRHLSVAVIR